MEEQFGQFGERSWSERKCAAIEADCAVQPEGVLVAEIQQEIVGYITIRFDTPSAIGWIANLAVAPHCQGSGIGRALLNEGIALCRDNGMQIVKIETLEHNEVGRHLYPSLGFTELARQVHYALDLRSFPQSSFPAHEISRPSAD
jgi:ribosomal protein S18 acetylase RimI-like enzyme